jgi:hypothetical protein
MINFIWLRFRAAPHENQAQKKAVDAHALVLYDHANTGKEVILKYMSSYHSEVAAA